MNEKQRPSGPGFLAAAAADRGAVAVGLDIAEAMVAEASHRYPQIEFHQGAAESLPFDDHAFDAVVNALGMPHFADPTAFFRGSGRVLRSGDSSPTRRGFRPTLPNAIHTSRSWAGRSCGPAGASS